MSDSLPLHESQARPPCPSPTPRIHPNSCPSSRWCHPAISSSVVPFSSCPQSLPASESFPMIQLLAWGGQTIGVSTRQGIEEVKKWHSRVRLALDRVSVVEDNVNASLWAISSFSLPMEPQFCMGGDASSSRKWITIYLSQFWPMIYKGKSLKVFQVIKSHKWVKLFSSLPLYFRCYNVFS